MNLASEYWGNKNIYGFSMGVLMLKSSFPRVPGEIGNATTFDFPVLCRYVDEANAPNVVHEGKPEVLLELLMKREKESSTAISPGLAIPHIIIEGERTFCILLARFKQGITFSESDPLVHAAFVLVGTRDERNFHLRALSAIAQIVQDPQFERKWLRAKSDKALRNVILTAKRKRFL